MSLATADEARSRIIHIELELSRHRWPWNSAASARLDRLHALLERLKDVSS
jgi:hypothetical protein